MSSKISIGRPLESTGRPVELVYCTMFKKKFFLSNIPQAGFEPMTCSRMKGTSAYNLSAIQLV